MVTRFGLWLVLTPLIAACSQSRAAAPRSVENATMSSSSEKNSSPAANAEVGPAAEEADALGADGAHPKRRRPPAGKGPVGGPGRCQKDDDCRLFSNYCETSPCTCVALGLHEPPPKCKGGQVQCFADPCGRKRAVCKAATGRCEVAGAAVE